MGSSGQQRTLNKLGYPPSRVTKSAPRSVVYFRKIAVIGDTARLRHSKFGVFDRPTEFCKWLLVGKAHVGVVVPKEQKELREILGTLLPHADRLRRSSASIVVYAPAAYMRTQGLRDARSGVIFQVGRFLQKQFSK